MCLILLQHAHEKMSGQLHILTKFRINGAVSESYEGVLMTRYVRGVLALIVGAVLFSLMSTVLLVASVLTFGLARPLLVHAPMWMGKVMVAVMYRGILGMRIDVPPSAVRRHGEQVIGMANHPTLLIAMILGAYFEPLVGVPLVFVGKRELLMDPFTGPFIGWPLLVSGLGIFIDRSKGNRSVEKIRRTVQGVVRRGCGLGILPDMSRPTPSAIAKDQEKFEGKVPDLQDFRYTLVPREGGVFACWDGMRRPRLIDVTLTCSVPAARWTDVFGMVGATCTMTVKDVSDEAPSGTQERRDWLLRLWREKNVTLAAARGE